MQLGTLDYHARLYDPVIGRFTQPDTLVPEPFNPQDFNRYSYVLNNPLKYTDPTGHLPDPLTDTELDTITQHGVNNSALATNNPLMGPPGPMLASNDLQGTGGSSGSSSGSTQGSTSEVLVAANAGIDDRVEVSTPSTGSITTTTDMLGGLEPGMTAFDHPSVDPGEPFLALSVNAGLDFVQGFSILEIAILKGNGSADLAIRQLLGQPHTLSIRAGLGFTLGMNGIAGLALTAGGAYMIGSSINSMAPWLGTGQPGILFYEWRHPEPVPGSLIR